ncbi:MAG: hypothetical protein FIB01_00925 [Gemmatimonadetes bacterium]|nr:hypothetical protein [Gemmatimonadota bacterium]
MAAGVTGPPNRHARPGIPDPCRARVSSYCDRHPASYRGRHSASYRRRHPAFAPVRACWRGPGRSRGPVPGPGRASRRPGHGPDPVRGPGTGTGRPCRSARR